MNYYFLEYPNRYRKHQDIQRSTYQDVIAGMKSGKYLSDVEWANLKYEKELLQIYRQRNIERESGKEQLDASG
jgi:hypothetical protein|tara:strand:+ start:728 stop:946 length:219 start_codon:yes stop_codon:yes gene_type:complete